ncbi:lipoyl(octanoyl) transferase LipB [Allokutzneria albata]|uniref:Octanoyltransferase n=1 Tax=Allokutzneria albata TaxID=211114 RepID=A0A1H0CMP8_ALLAB|nr:lipoyl(octanoyl) transferase LipB [Allokutzneria albata]SDN59166.1 lipoyl(octanoyl) transferase [Allokutzneria albata]
MSRPDISCRVASTPVQVRHLGLIDYVEAWELQRELAEARANGTGPDQLLLLEHHSVYTAGKRTQPEDRPDDGTPVVEVDRGGKITWHGPGQLVGYPLIALAEPVDVVDYVRRLEQALIVVCQSFGLEVGRVEGRSGVWLAGDATRQERKIAAIGIRVQRGVTMHGFSLNCEPDTKAFDRIVPCGLTGVGVTSLSEEVGRRVTVAEALPLAERAVLAALEGEIQVSETNIARTGPTAPGITFALQN